MGVYEPKSSTVALNGVAVERSGAYNPVRMPAPSRLRKVAGALILVAAGLACLIGGPLYRWQRRASETFDRHAKDLKSRAPRAEARTLQRPALFMPPLEGDAWDSYVPILPFMGSFQWKVAWQNPSPEEHDKLLTAYNPVLKGLREAFSKETLTLPQTTEEALFDDGSFSKGVILATQILRSIAAGYHTRHRDSESLETLLLMLALSSDLRQIRAGGIWPAQWGIGNENGVFDAWRTLLEGHSLSSEELARALTLLDRLFSARSSIHHGVAAHGLLWRQYMLDWEREGRTDFPYGERPSWRYAYSARLGRATALNEIEVTWNRLESLEKLPTSQWTKTLETISGQQGSLAISKPFSDVYSAIQMELVSLRMWTSARVAMAIARFEVEKERFPAFLAELVPEYLPAIPSCPEGGEALRYKPGEISCEHSSSRWKVSRRK